MKKYNTIMVDEKILKFTQKGLILTLKVCPNSSKNQLVFSEDRLKLKVTAQPIENKANKAVIEYLSKLFKVPKTYLSIIKGDTSKDKTVLFEINDDKKCEFILSVLSDLEKSGKINNG